MIYQVTYVLQSKMITKRVNTLVKALRLYQMLKEYGVTSTVTQVQ